MFLTTGVISYYKHVSDKNIIKTYLSTDNVYLEHHHCCLNGKRR